MKQRGLQQFQCSEGHSNAKYAILIGNIVMKGHSEDIIEFVRLSRDSQTSQFLRGASVTHVFKSICDAKHFSRVLSVSLHKLLYQQTSTFPGAFTLIQQ